MGNSQTVPVGPVAVAVFPSVYGSALTLYNSGSVTLFIGEAPGLSVANGFPLSPGSSIVWDEGKPVYGVSASGTGQITVLNNAGNLNDVSALANAIIDAGLASDIANQISLKGAPNNQGIRAGDTFQPQFYIHAFAGSPGTFPLVAPPGVGKSIIMCQIIGSAPSDRVQLIDTNGKTIYNPTASGQTIFDFKSLALADNVGINYDGSASGSVTIDFYYAIGLSS